MASITIGDNRLFPAGTTVYLYRLSDFAGPTLSQGQTPPSTHLDSGTMDPDVTFTGLSDGDYVVGGSVGGSYRYVNAPIVSVRTSITEDQADALDEFSVVTAEVHDDFTQAPLGDFTSRVADSGQTYHVTGAVTPTIEEVNGYRVLSLANGTADGIQAFYLELGMSANTRFIFAQVMYGDVGSTDDSAISLAAPRTSLATTPDAGYDIGVHGVYSASGGLEASTWVDMTAQNNSDLDGSTLIGAGDAPDPNEPVWIGWILCENGHALSLTPAGVIAETKDTRYIINSGPYAWVEPYATEGDTDVRPYVLKWAAGTSVSEAVAAYGSHEELGRLVLAAEKIQSSQGDDVRGDNVTDVATIANTTETDLHSYAISGGTCGANKDKIIAKFAGTTAANGNNKRIRVYFGGTVVFDSTAQAFNNVHWCVDLTIVRVSATTFRAIATGTFGTVSLAAYTDVTATAANAQTLKVTGLNGTASANDIVAKISTWQKAHAA